MASGRIRSTRRLRNWMVEQVSVNKWQLRAIGIPLSVVSLTKYRRASDCSVFTFIFVLVVFGLFRNVELDSPGIAQHQIGILPQSSLHWAQVTSGKYAGLIWDDEAKTMFRIPWKHAGKQDFRSDEDAAIFKVGYNTTIKVLHVD